MFCVIIILDKFKLRHAVMKKINDTGMRIFLGQECGLRREAIYSM